MMVSNAPSATQPSRSQIVAVESAPVGEVCYLLHRPDRPEALVFDPGHDVAAIHQQIAALSCQIAAILLTHGHYDHIAGVAALKQAWPQAPILIGVNEQKLLADPLLNLGALVGESIVSPPADRLVHHGEIVHLGGWDLEVREIPGHSPGHVVYLVHHTDPPWVISGDVVFLNSVGRTDLPGCDHDQLVSGIHANLLSLPDTTRLFPGHGPPTTVGRERRVNPFLRKTM